MKKSLTMRLIPALMMIGFAGAAGASGFALQNQSGSANGNAFAGAAAAAEDASTIFFNPAGMTYMPTGHTITLSGTILDRSIKFKNTGTTNSTLNNATPSNGGEAGGTAFLPHGYWSWSVAPDVWFGVGVGPTFGNKTEYDKNFIGRNAGYFAEIEHVNINPSFAIKVNDMLSLGLGVNFTRAHVAFKQGVPLNTAIPGNTNQNYLHVEGDAAWGVGANIGAMFQLSPSTRLGIAYRSAIDFDIDGKQKYQSRITGGGAALSAATTNQDVKAEGYRTPGNLSFAVSQKLSDRWELLGDLTWTDWSVWKSLKLTTASGTQLASLSYNFEDTWRVGLGANYKYNDAWKFRFGVAFDESPIAKNSDRTMTLPDSDRTWLSFGAKYTLSKNSSLDVGYSHIFFKDAKADRAVQVSGTTVQTVRGEWNNNRADLLSVQYNHTF
ncbi:MAG: outer membrane protein transport protein [Zoogloeaceae bacterium]|nr:outer membrane protein transport protein [Zoogloeaceae bacterium]